MSNWTPGPWGIYHGRDATGEGFAEVRAQGGNGHAVVTWFDDMDDEPDATLELIALAPEMAEAVLSLDRLSCPTHTRIFGSDGFETFSASCVECGAILKVRKLAAKLRAIGEDNE